MVPNSSLPVSGIVLALDEHDCDIPRLLMPPLMRPWCPYLRTSVRRALYKYLKMVSRRASTTFTRLTRGSPARLSTGKHLIMPEQGRAGMNMPAPISLDYWPAYSDRDENLEVFFAIYKPPLPSSSVRDLRWSICWKIQNHLSWRHIQAVQEQSLLGLPPQPRYVYWGALTKSAGPADASALRHLMGVYSLADRRRLEQLALEIPVMAPGGTWNCQDWLQELLNRMVAAGLLSREGWEAVFAFMRAAY